MNPLAVLLAAERERCTRLARVRARLRLPWPMPPEAQADALDRLLALASAGKLGDDEPKRRRR